MFELDPVDIVIVDPDPESRSRLRDLATGRSGLRVAGECDRLSEARGLIASCAPDLVFMELHLPDGHALDWLEEIGPDNVPPVVIAAREGHDAAKALELQVIDYLLKPVNPDRVLRCLDRHRAYRGSVAIRTMNAKLEKALRALTPSATYLDRVAVRTRRGAFVFLEIGKVDSVDAAGNYVRLNTAEQNFLVRQTMTALEKQLDPRVFIRIHRSTIVNIESIGEVRQRQSGELVIVLQGGKRLNVGRCYRDRVSRLLGRSDKAGGDPETGQAWLEPASAPSYT